MHALSFCCHHTAAWCLVFTRCLHSSSGVSWNHHQVVGLSDHFRKIEGVQLREDGWRQHLYEGRPRRIAAFLVGWSFLIEFKGLATAISLKMQEPCPILSPKPYRLPLLLCNYVSLLTSHLSVGFFNPWNELLVFTLRLQTYESTGNCHDGQLAFTFSIR